MTEYLKQMYQKLVILELFVKVNMGYPVFTDFDSIYFISPSALSS